MIRFTASTNDWCQSPPWDTDWLARGQRYCQQVQRLLPHAGYGDSSSSAHRQGLIWIGRHIHRLNQKLWQLTQACNSCFFDHTYPPVQPWAFPLEWGLATDPNVVGLCSLNTNPVALVIDVGQIHPDDWLGVVAHEFAHAISGAGHGPEFRSTLTHLCIGLGLSPPTTLGDEQLLQQWPPYRPQPPGFWTGGTISSL